METNSFYHFIFHISNLSVDLSISNSKSEITAPRTDAAPILRTLKHFFRARRCLSGGPK
jgi:hypothetical protein